MTVPSTCPHCGASLFITQPLTTGGNALYCKECGGAVDWPDGHKEGPPDRMLSPVQPDDNASNDESG